MEEREGKLGWALMLACPACAGGFFLAIGAAFGATALAIKGFALAGLVTLVLGMWARNYWRRRAEEQEEPCCIETPSGPTTSTAGSSQEG